MILSASLPSDAVINDVSCTNNRGELDFATNAFPSHFFSPLISPA